jgi:hypothetical protein
MASNPATLVRLPEKSAAWLQDQADKIHKEYGKHMGRSPVLMACVDALAALKVDFSDCPNTQEITCKLMRLLNARFTGVR